MYQKGRVWATLRKAMRFREGKGCLQVRKEGWRDVEGIAAIAGTEPEAAAASWTGRLHSPVLDAGSSPCQKVRSGSLQEREVVKFFKLLQRKYPRRVLEKASTVCGYFRGHCVKIFHLVASHVVDDLFQPGNVFILLFGCLAFSKRSHLDEDLVICGS